MKVKITVVSDDYLGGYDGMNYEAAKFLGFDKPIKEDEILINKSLDFTLKIHTIIHEIDELQSMKEGLPYLEAHKEALKTENILKNIKAITDYVFGNRNFYNLLTNNNVSDEGL